MSDRARPPGTARRRAVLVVHVAALLWAQMLAIATASFSAAPNAAMDVSSATLSAPSGLTAQNTGCVVLVLTQVQLDWTATPSTWADGYNIERSLINGGPYASVGTVGAGTTTYTDSTVLFATTYYYVARATKLAWTSPASNQVSITTPSTLCL